VTGGDGGGGEATIGSANASVAVGRSAVIDVSSTSAGQGGEISIDSGIGCIGTHAVLVEGRLDADGGPNGGSGGAISVSGGESVRIADTSSIRAAGTLGGGGGGTVSVAAATGNTLVEAAMDISGAGPNGPGGIVSLEAAGLLRLTAPIDAAGFGAGGQIGFSTETGPVEILADIDVRSTAAAGGVIEVVGFGDVRVGGILQTDGAVAPGGEIRITGCEVTICGLDAPGCPDGVTAILSSLGPSGVNRITARRTAAILGTLRARASDGRNEFVFPDGEEPLVRGQVTPAAMSTVDNGLGICPTCGNNTREAPETCDDGNRTDGDGCSASCQMEQATPGDANGDTRVSAEDVTQIIREIFDSDADVCGAVTGGTVASSAGADANLDERVTAADITATIQLLAP
jgi:cysteine-rich repeat protein